MRRHSAIIGVVLSFILPIMAAAQEAMQFPVQEFQLDNGMTFLVVERHTAPIFAGFICAAVGSANEHTGNIGSAHLLEHMMFKGSQSIGTTDYKAEAILMAREDSVWNLIDSARQETPFITLNQPEKLAGHQKYIDDHKKVLDSLSALSSQYAVQNEYDRIYTRNGAAEFNANTGYDQTNYFVSLPSNRMELWFSMESDRLKHPAFREFYPERDVVSEERRNSVENNPDSKLLEQLIGAAFIAHPYHVYWEWQSDENNLKRRDLDKFFKTFYIPQRLTVALVGDVRLDDVKKLAQQYFGDMPRGIEPEPIYTAEPEQPGERRVEVEFESSPAVFIAYHMTAFDSPEEPTFQVINRLLGDGRTSRLYNSLVIDKQLCLDISVSMYPWGDLGNLYPSIFTIYAYPKEGVSTAEVEKEIYAELDKLAATPVDTVELTKIKNKIDADFIWGFYSNMGLAGRLASSQNEAHDWRYLLKFRNNLKAVSSDNIMAVAKKYLVKKNRTVATLIPIQTGGAQ